MLSRLKAAFRRRVSPDPIFGFQLAFVNVETGVRYEGYPHEILQRMTSDGRRLRAVVDNLETQIEATEVHGVPYLALEGAPAPVAALMAALESHRLDDARRILAAHPGLLAGAEEQAAFPLLARASAGDAAAVTLLLEEGAPIDALDDLGMSPLHWAAAYGREKVVRVLLDHGADREETSFLFVTPADLAGLNGHGALSALLSEGLRFPYPVGSGFLVIQRMDEAMVARE